MEKIISRMLDSYEGGAVSRRQLIQGLVAVAAAAQAGSASASTFQGMEINHVALAVTNVPRYRDFYQKHFGLPVVRQDSGACFLGMGKNFLALFHKQNAGMDHFCIAIRDYQADSVVEELKRQGLNPRRPAGSNRVYFPDPDGLEVQVSAANHQP